LDSALEAWRFSSHYGFSFGGRKRGYGYMPQGEQFAKWCGTFIAATEKIALTDGWQSEKARRILARRFRSLWTRAHMFDALERSAKNLHKSRSWNEGWVAIRETLKYDKDDRAPEIVARLKFLETELTPHDLEQKCRAYIFSDTHTLSFLDDLDEDGSGQNRIGRAEEIACDLGIQLGVNEDLFQKLLSDLVIPARRGMPSHFHAFGRGLAQSANKQEIWAALKEQIAQTDVDKRNPDALRGMVFAMRQSDPAQAETWLDEVLKDPVLERWLPIFQYPIDQRGLERLHEALDKNITDLWFYQQIAYGRAHEAISDDDLARLIQKISAKENGRYAALEILNMRFYRDGSERETLPPHSEELLSVARGLLSTHSFEDKSHRQDSDYNLSKIAKECLKGEAGAAAVASISKNLSVQIGTFKVYAGDYPQLLNSLAEVHPQAFMDTFLGEDTDNIRKDKLFSHDFERDRNPIDHIPDNAIIAWCEKNPARNYPIIADIVKAFDDPQGEDLQPQWRPVVQLLFEKAPDLEKVLHKISENIRPNGWSGSLASILQRRLALFPHLFDHPNSLISSWARQVHNDLLENIPKIRNSEMMRSRDRDESFEW
jgi:hypothetical protein